MGLTIADAYYLKAKSASSGFFSDWNEVCENLNYALSYDEEHCASLILLGEIYASKLMMKEKAFACFDKVISIDPHNVEVYGTYIFCLVLAKEIKRADKLITFALTNQEIDKAYMYWLSACVDEIQGNYKQSLKHLKQAKKDCYNDNYFRFMQDEEKRIKKKIDLEKPKKKTSSASKKKKRKKNKNK